MASLYSVNDIKYFSIRRFLSSERLMWKFIIKVSMLSAILFSELLLLIVLVASPFSLRPHDASNAHHKTAIFAGKRFHVHQEVSLFLV